MAFCGYWLVVGTAILNRDKPLRPVRAEAVWAGRDTEKLAKESATEPATQSHCAENGQKCFSVSRPAQTAPALTGHRGWCV